MTEAVARAAETLPERWPATTAVQPVRPWWLPWPIAVLAVPLLWVLPKWMGPHFAAVRWPGVIAAHLLWTFYGVACVYLAAVAPQYGWVAWLRQGGVAEFPEYPPMTFSQTARAPVAQVIWDMCSRTTFGTAWYPGFPAISSVADVLLWLAVVAGVEIGLGVLALLLMPYLAAGERAGQLLIRAVKLALLATTVIVPVSLVLQWWVLKPRWLVREDVLYTTVTALGCVWFCWIVMRAGRRYPGPAEGPGWESRKVLCEYCGYVLTMLTAAHRCPGCGRPVGDSLPANRRPTPLATAKGAWSATTGFLRTTVAVLGKRDFYRRIPVHSEFEAARRFAIWTSVAAFPFAMLLLAVCMWCVLGPEDAKRAFEPAPLRERLEQICGLGYAWSFTGVGFLLILGGISLLAALCARQPIRLPATVVFYWSAWIVPLITIGCLAVASLVVMNRAGWFDGPGYEVLRFGILNRHVVLAPLIFFVLTLPAFIFAVYRLFRGWGATRFANA
jgi:hypothetical protein